MSQPDVKLELTFDQDDRLWLRVNDVPLFELKPDETIIECLNRVGDKFDRQVDYPTKGDDPWARDYAHTLWGLASRLQKASSK
jgi:hypothetical protein